VSGPYAPCGFVVPTLRAEGMIGHMLGGRCPNTWLGAVRACAVATRRGCTRVPREESSWEDAPHPDGKERTGRAAVAPR
jgi:hypothetical protein